MLALFLLLYAILIETLTWIILELDILIVNSLTTGEFFTLQQFQFLAEFFRVSVMEEQGRLRFHVQKHKIVGQKGNQRKRKFFLLYRFVFGFLTLVLEPAGEGQLKQYKQHH